MRRMLVLLLILCLLLSACAAKGPSDAETQKEAAREQLAAAEAGAAEEAERQENRTSLLEDSETLIQGDGFSVTLLDYAADANWGPVLSLELVNETDRDLMYVIGNMSVNGVMCDPFWGCEVPAGETATSDVWWGEELLAERGILALRDLRMEFLIFDSEDYEADYFYNDVVTLTLPAGEEIVEDVTFADFPEQVLAEGEGYRVTALRYDPDGWYGPAVLLCLVNETEANLIFSADDVTVDGADCDPFWAQAVWAGCRAYSEMSWDAEDLKEAGVDGFGDVAFRLSVFDADNWDEDALHVEETVSIELP